MKTTALYISSKTKNVTLLNERNMKKQCELRGYEIIRIYFDPYTKTDQLEIALNHADFDVLTIPEKEDISLESEIVKDFIEKFTLKGIEIFDMVKDGDMNLFLEAFSEVVDELEEGEYEEEE